MKIKYLLTVILLGLVLVLLVGSAAAKPPVTVNNQVIWELKKAVIVHQGELTPAYGYLRHYVEA